MWLENKDSTKKQFIKSYGYKTRSYNQFSFPGDFIKFNINWVDKYFIFKLKSVKKSFRKIFESVNTWF